ncbi:cytochrome P450 [Xylaria cf. heliscus]|nr:cytochrome P450 [Xylaria cf. heliscus]
MYRLVVTTTLSLFAAYVFSLVLGLRKNHGIATSSGFKCVLLPTHITSVPWLVAGSIFLPLLDLLPEERRAQWMPLLLLDRIWHSGYRPFAISGADTIMAVAPSQNILFTCDPKLITQLLRNPAFGKPTALLGLLNLFGPTMTGTDGPENKLYRKVVAPYFNQTTMDRVFRESLDATSSLIQVLAEHAGPVDDQLRPMLSKLALHILAKCGFGKEGSCLEELKFSEKSPDGHELSFADTFLGIDQDLPLIALTPPPVLNNSPLQVHKRGRTLKTEMQKYLLEAIEQQRASPNKAVTETKSLLDFLVEAGDNDGLLSGEQIMGNIFILHFAGHESNAHALQFALLNLACQPQVQAKVQSDIDRIVGKFPPKDWSYTEHYTALAQSMVGAAINESLRVYTVLPIFMKQTTESPVTVNVDGRDHVIPPHTLIVVNTSATHRNPSYWSTPTGSAKEGVPYAVSSFNPERWFDQHGKFLVPEPGSYIPFSDGPRGCIGQRFAMVELCASLALILRQYNIELATTGSDGANILENDGNASQQVRDRAIHQLSGGIMFNMTLRLGDKIPVRFTKRA